MPSHMTALGFPVYTEQDFRHYVYEASEFGQTIQAANGSYTCWAAGYGIELWVQINLHKRIIGMNPHFSGQGRMRTYLTRRVMRREHTILDGAFYGWGREGSTDADAIEFPFVFDLPDYDLYNEVGLPCHADVQLAAFAHRLQGYASEEAYQQEEELLAVESFVPSGLFISGERGEAKEPPQALALFSGRVIAAEQIPNPVTHQRFQWALVRTLGGEVDIVADPQVVQGKITINGIVKGAFWLSGRLVQIHQ